MADATDGYQYLYQVGDVVRVRDDLKRGWYPMNNEPGHGIIALTNMIELAGAYVTISERTSILNHHCYRIAEADCFWTDGMFDGKKEPALMKPDNSWEEFFLS